MRTKRMLVIIFLFAFAVRMFFFDTSYLVWDETIYMLHGKLYASHDVGYNEIFLRPPLLPFIISMFSNLPADKYEILSKMLLIFLNSLIIFPTYYLGCLLDKRVGVLSAVFISVLPASIVNSRYVLTDHPGAVLALSCFVLFFLGAKERKDYYVYVGSFLLGLSILMKFTNLLLFILVIPFVFAMLVEKRVKVILRAVCVFVGVLFPYLVYNVVRFGSPFYTFIRAWHVVEEHDPVDMGFVFYVFNDAFGFVFLFLAFFGVVFFVIEGVIKKHVAREERLFNAAILFGFFVVWGYFVSIVSRGVAKPFGIEWEVERFMILLITFGIVFVAYLLVGLYDKFGNKRIGCMVLVIVSVAGFLCLVPQYERMYTPQIEFEDGLRYVTLDMAYYIKTLNVTTVACMGNCPPIAYYSEKNMVVFYDKELLMSSGMGCLVVFEKIDDDAGFCMVESICKGSSCVFLYCLVQEGVCRIFEGEVGSDLEVGDV